jgi:hypothetical protein
VKVVVACAEKLAPTRYVPGCKVAGEVMSVVKPFPIVDVIAALVKTTIGSKVGPPSQLGKLPFLLGVMF